LGKELTRLTTVVFAALSVLADRLVWRGCRKLVALAGSRAGSHDGRPRRGIALIVGLGGAGDGVRRGASGWVDGVLGDGGRGSGARGIGGVIVRGGDRGGLFRRSGVVPGDGCRRSVGCGYGHGGGRVVSAGRRRGRLS
jgi:hypothetical protein